MKKRNNKIYGIMGALLLLFAAVGLQAKDLVVFSVVGGPKLVTDKGSVAIKAYDHLTLESVVNIPYDASIVLLDEENRKQYTLKTPGRDRISVFLADKKNGILELTQRYWEYMYKQLTNGSKVSARRYSDPATVTREQQTYQEEDKDDFVKEFEDFTNQAREEYEDFRKQVNEEYAEFMKYAWKTFRSAEPIPAPKEEEVEPLTLPELEMNVPSLDQLVKVEEIVVPMTPSPQPVPIEFTIESIPDQYTVVDPQLPTVPTVINDPTLSLQPIEKLVIDRSERHEPVGEEMRFFGTTVFVRFSEDARFSLDAVTDIGISEAWGAMSAKELQPTLLDCLNIRKQLRLSDWAYLLLLEEVGNTFLDKGSNEAVMLAAWLFCQSGYKMRIARTDSQLVLLFASRHLIYEYAYFTIDDEMFYPLHQINDELSVCVLPYPEEQSLSLLIGDEPILAEEATEVRILEPIDKKFDIKVPVSVNKNLLDFYAKYPTSEIGENVCTRWAMYANTPLDYKVKEQLYPPLKEKIEGLGQQDAVNYLLAFVQWSLVYKYDEDIWGHDRAFFAEETLHYPYADCEDRSILFSRLVRDLLGLKVVLVYYPGHLAAAVNLPDDVTGDYLLLDGKRFVICDATYFGAPAGKTMPGMDNKQAKAILLN